MKPLRLKLLLRLLLLRLLLLRPLLLLTLPLLLPLLLPVLLTLLPVLLTLLKALLTLLKALLTLPRSKHFVVSKKAGFMPAFLLSVSPYSLDTPPFKPHRLIGNADPILGAVECFCQGRTCQFR